MRSSIGSERRSSLVVGLNVGIGLVFLSLPLPWARVAGRTRTGPAFADLLLGLPDVPLLGRHLEIVALLWYSIPLLALATWLTQFRAWPPSIDGWTLVGAALLGVAVALLMVWLAVRGVGFPQPGGVIASLGAALTLAVAVLDRRRRSAVAGAE